MALELNGTTGVSLVQDGAVTAADLASGAITTSALPAGSVIQVVQATDNTLFTQTATTYSDSSVTASITPTSSSSKILVTGAIQIMGYNNAAANAEGYFRIKNSTTSTNSPDSFMQIYDYGNSGSISDTAQAVHWLDSPASTASQTYVIQLKRGGGTAIRANNGGTSVLTLMEIAG